MKQSIALLFLLLLSPWLQAADAQGQFSVRGIGLINCDTFLREQQANTETYREAVGWVDGYLTALNEHQPETYDSTSFETTGMLLAAISRQCHSDPQARVFDLLRSLLKAIHPDRLQGRSSRQTVVRGDRQTVLYTEVLQRLQKKLAGLGDYRGRFDGHYSEDTVAAIKRYQTSVGLNPTGFPDQHTLWRLFRGTDPD